MCSTFPRASLRLELRWSAFLHFEDIDTTEMLSHLNQLLFVLHAITVSSDMIETVCPRDEMQPTRSRDTDLWHVFCRSLTMLYWKTRIFRAVVTIYFSARRGLVWLNSSSPRSARNVRLSKASETLNQLLELQHGTFYLHAPNLFRESGRLALVPNRTSPQTTPRRHSCFLI